MINIMGCGPRPRLHMARDNWTDQSNNEYQMRRANQTWSDHELIYSCLEPHLWFYDSEVEAMIASRMVQT